MDETMPFDNEKYKQKQKNEIYKRIDKYNKLYIEVGGKLFDDNHASRVLPGFDPNVKMQVFKEIKNDMELIFCINSKNIVLKKVREDNGLAYEDEIIRLVECMRSEGINVCGIVINFYEKHPAVQKFEKKCKEKNINVYRSYYIDDYPHDTSKILSKDGFGKNDYVKTTKKIILVAAPGPNSGKLKTCLSQLYNDKVRGINSGYAKYETFPVWDLPLDHPVNLAYEMATADLGDVNMIDPFYKNSSGKIAVNYNRDIEAFPVLSNMLKLINGCEVYNSPTDMGINNVSFGIVSDYGVKKASMEEIERRYIRIQNAVKDLKTNVLTLDRAAEILNKARELYKDL